MGVDAGSVRVGVAVSDRGGSLASPLETVARVQPRQPGRRKAAAARADLARIAALAAEHEVIEVVVGLPLSLSGRAGAAAESASAYARELAAVVAPVPVRLVDERLTTVSAHTQLAEAGLRSAARRGVVDQAAAVIILQSALDAERASGRPPGRLVDEPGQAKGGEHGE